MHEKVAQPDAMVAAVASRQHGVVTIRQLRACGLTDSAVLTRVRAGRLHRLHRGVYAVGHAGVSREGSWIGAVLACGPGAVLSHRSAAALWDLLPVQNERVDVSTPARSGRAKQRGICLHRHPSLATEPAASRLGIPVTTPARTLGDLRPLLPPWQWRKALRQAEFKRLPLGPIETDGTRSDLESDFLGLCRRHRLPQPEVNVRVGKWTVDFLWRRDRLAVETDFYDYHRGSVCFEDDHQRDLDLRRLGYRTRRYTGAQLRNHPALVVADLGEVLGGVR
jgi:very-short-patch-repair endonuclease